MLRERALLETNYCENNDEIIQFKTEKQNLKMKLQDELMIAQEHMKLKLENEAQLKLVEVPSSLNENDKQDIA